MMLLKIFVFGLITTSIVAEAQTQECLPLMNKTLKSLNYGIFDHPRAGVTKTEAKNSWVFESPGATRVVFSSGKIEEFLHIAGMNVATTINFDTACAVTSVSGVNFGGVASLTSKADVNECKKLRMKASQSPPMLNVGEILSLGWCGEYFPTSSAGVAPPAGKGPAGADSRTTR